jgi:uncharacterized protein (DUF1501 family)
MTINRREFMMGCSSAIAALAGARINNMVFANEEQAAANDEVMVVVFLRGGCDGLGLVTPFDDSRYVSARPTFKTASTGAASHIQFDPQNATFKSSLGFHFNAAPLKELYDSKKLAIVHACGLNDDTRSHFDAMDYMERGTPGLKNTSNGWIARHLDVVNAGGALPVLSSGGSNPTSLLANNQAVALNSPRDFKLSTFWRYNGTNNTTMFDTLRQLYKGSGPMEVAGKRTIETIDTLKSFADLNYTPDYPYPNHSFGTALQTIAQTIKLDMGLRVATVDLGGWDTHESQGVGTNGYYSNLVNVLARGLHAFYNDMASKASKLTVVVMSEFGRRLGVNASNGTDHGHGNVMFVLGGKTNGGKVYGAWPGLEDLDQSQDLKITTDYRTVLSEILIRRLGNNKLGIVFPGFANYKALGLTGSASEDVAPDYTMAQKNVYIPLVRR